MSGSLLLAPAWVGQSGLWLVDAKGRRKPVDAEDAGLSDDLADRLESWMDSFDAIYDEDDEAASDFAGDAEREAFLREGEAIAAAIRAELGDDEALAVDLTGWRAGAAP